MLGQECLIGSCELVIKCMKDAFPSNFLCIRAHLHLCVFFSDCNYDSCYRNKWVARTQWKCSHYVTATTSPTPIQSTMSKNQIAVANRTV